MNDITANFGTLYHPVKALVIYEKQDKEQAIYIESYDMDERGFPINAHPLTVRESMKLAKSLDSSQELKRSFLKPAGLLPQNILYINPDHNGYAVWHTPQQSVDLLFIDGLGIPNGKANIPPLLWKAGKDALYIYALNPDTSITSDTKLFDAPFFNIHKDGKVCMGTVAVRISGDCLLEAFMLQWESYFFNSYFSHLIQEHSPIKSNIVQLWKDLSGTGKKFPLKLLKENGKTIKNIL